MNKPAEGTPKKHPTQATIDRLIRQSAVGPKPKTKDDSDPAHGAKPGRSEPDDPWDNLPL